MSSTLLFLYSLSAVAYDLNNFFYDDYLNTKIFLNPNLIPGVYFNPDLELDNFDYIKNDPEKLVNPEFHIPDYLSESVKFWFDIYSKYDENTTLIHDKTHFDLVYNTINFTELDHNNVGKVTKANFRKQIERERFLEIKLAISHIFDGKKLNSFELKILEKITQANIEIPAQAKKKTQLKNSLLRGLRRQSGLKNQVEQGIGYYNNLHDSFMQFLQLFELPDEIMAIAFVESSFNIKAHSRAGAVGVWQFIRSTGNSFLKITPEYDERKNILLSTLGAFHLLKQNYKIHKSWPFAISAYNSGHKHILNARRINKKSDFDFQKFLDDYSHSDIRFASKNYYSEVLAMIFSIKYQKLFYKNITTPTTEKLFLYKKNNYSSLARVSQDIGVDINDLKMLNPHLPKKLSSANYVTIVSNKMIERNDYQLINDEQIKKYFPKNFYKIPKSKAAR